MRGGGHQERQPVRRDDVSSDVGMPHHQVGVMVRHGLGISAVGGFEDGMNGRTMDKRRAKARIRSSLKPRIKRVNGDNKSTGMQKSGGQKPKGVNEGWG